MAIVKQDANYAKTKKDFYIETKIMFIGLPGIFYSWLQELPNIRSKFSSKHIQKYSWIHLTDLLIRSQFHILICISSDKSCSQSFIATCRTFKCPHLGWLNNPWKKKLRWNEWLVKKLRTHSTKTKRNQVFFQFEILK